MDKHMIERMAQSYENDQRFYLEGREKIDIREVHKDLLRRSLKLTKVLPLDPNAWTATDHEIARLRAMFEEDEFWTALQARLRRD